MNRTHAFRIASFSLLAALAVTPSMAQNGSGAVSRTITVAGDGEVKVAPDEVIIPMVLRTEAREVEEAKKENDTFLKDLRALIARLGVPEPDVTVDYISITPQQSGSDEYGGLSSRYRAEEGNEGPLGYYASRNLVVRLHNLKVLEELLAAMATMKPLYLGPLQLRNTEADRHREKARVEAVRSAREKAASMAGELGAKLGRPVAISEGGTLDDYLPSRGGSSAYAAGLYAMLAGAGAESGGVSLPGEISFSSRVRVTFELE